ncbi:hypothetical protein VCRA2114E365_220015 [Vibrio crassostreae]|nr:hypothetical protein VCRA2115O371_210013 [Vibrio crassostreae]CAK1915557.1 hypothetical protein VCRA2114O369_220012 [Vibrio crassostreae]CAK1920737.1 hypothetical protein VCRA2113O359_220011 [Vibrio crassostreae]CAK1921702.1 hypothetical protein VCRA2113O354_220012 [Vibrio crassostreae]CAK1922686.1 hypothetical protein VCRA2114O367_230013 [Vibrio crassostreae]
MTWPITQFQKNWMATTTFKRKCSLNICIEMGLFNFIKTPFRHAFPPRLSATPLQNFTNAKNVNLMQMVIIITYILSRNDSVVPETVQRAHRMTNKVLV